MWEANHVWLVLAVVIAFVAFPRLFSAIATYLHIPILCLLLGIVARGSAFTFRHYDPHSEESIRSLVHGVFCFGERAHTAVSGRDRSRPPSQRTLPRRPRARGFYAVYVAPWNTWFGWATGALRVRAVCLRGRRAARGRAPAREGAAARTCGLSRNACTSLPVALGAHWCSWPAYLEQRALAWRACCHDQSRRCAPPWRSSTAARAGGRVRLSSRSALALARRYVRSGGARAQRLLCGAVSGAGAAVGWRSHGGEHGGPQRHLALAAVGGGHRLVCHRAGRRLSDSRVQSSPCARTPKRRGRSPPSAVNFWHN